MISLDITEEADAEWNSRLIKSDLATIYQTKEWGNLLRNESRKPNFIRFIEENGEVVGQLLMFISQTSTDNSFLNKLISISTIKKPIYTWSYGPIIFKNNYSKNIMNSLINFLNTKRCKVKGIGHPLLSIEDLFLHSKLELEKWITFMINLDSPLNELYKKIQKHSGRKNIERSINRGVKIEEITFDTLKDYVNLMNLKRSEKEKLSLEYMQKIWNALKPLGYSGFLARKDGVHVGGMMFSFINGHIIEAGIVRSKDDFKENLYSQDLIKWKIIEWGVKNKMKYYNLAGANPNPTSKKEEGILRYKQKWGGEKYDYWILRR